MKSKTGLSKGFSGVKFGCTLMTIAEPDQPISHCHSSSAQIIADNQLLIYYILVTPCLCYNKNVHRSSLMDFRDLVT